MKVLLTGGSGRLGTELRELLAGSQAADETVQLTAPASTELDVNDSQAFIRFAADLQPDVVVHAAAYTDVARAETERASCWRVNVVGSRNAAEAAAGCAAKLVHISTDYVFWGDQGGYGEDDVLGPVRNYYALTKLVAEEAVRLAGKRLVIRTSFRPREWQYPVAFADLYTSQDYVDVIAPEIALAIRRCFDVPYETLHIATERKSVLELARRRSPAVEAGSRADSPVELPADVSLDCSRWLGLKRSWGEAS